MNHDPYTVIKFVVLACAVHMRLIWGQTTTSPGDIGCTPFCKFKKTLNLYHVLKRTSFPNAMQLSIQFDARGPLMHIMPKDRRWAHVEFDAVAIPETRSILRNNKRSKKVKTILKHRHAGSYHKVSGGENGSLLVSIRLVLEINHIPQYIF
jgi:hypothetical protein